jgi:2-aminoadipate transaminase
MKIIAATPASQAHTPPTVPPREEIFALADWVRLAERTSLGKMLDIGARPEILSFALGLPAPELFPAQDYATAVTQVLHRDALALQLGPPYRPLKQLIVKLMEQRGVECREGQVFLTSGAQQGLSLLARLLLNQRGQVIIEETAYTGLHMAIQPFQPKVLTVSSDAETGMDVEELERLLAGGARPAFIFAMSDGHNPLGVSLAQAKRERLVELARSFRVPIIEDDVYGLISYQDNMPAALRALDERWVFYVGSFSKIIGPALRTGWMIVPAELIPKLAIIKDLSDIDTCTLSQRAIAAYLDMGHLPAQLAAIRSEYKERRDLMIGALKKHFPEGTKWSVPAGGVFLWVTLPAGVDTIDLLKIAVEREQVAFIPGAAFGVAGDSVAKSSLRLNFTYCSRELIEEGIMRLSRALKELEVN